MTVRIQNYKIIDFQELIDRYGKEGIDNTELLEIMKAYNEQITEMKFYIDDLRKQIIISDGYRIKIIDLR
jgi:hypothetical protein